MDRLRASFLDLVCTGTAAIAAAGDAAAAPFLLLLLRPVLFALDDSWSLAFVGVSSIRMSS
jgi:hypothetical protein